MTYRAKAYIAGMLGCGAGVSAFAFAHRTDSPEWQFLFYLLLAVLASPMKVSLPGIRGTLSVSFFFVLVGVVEFGLLETLHIGALATLVQCFWKAKERPKAIQLGFSVASILVAIFAAWMTFHVTLPSGWERAAPLMVLPAAAAYFAVNTLSIAGVIGLSEGKSILRVWRECYFWSFPHYLVGASLAGLISLLNRWIGWEAPILIMPVAYLIFRSYRVYLERLEREKQHAEETAALYLRTIEGLALAIEAKDNTTHDHLQRVQVYAMELGKELGLNGEEMHALQAASILHDIGKLAVPEHIITKPGKLTPEEFEKMKIHPVVGAEILERIQFPYPVSPIVRSHHEKWDGSGYPDGLAGSDIPVGARILAAVDCLDALASHRQYRPALPLDEAMDKVAEQAGRSFDPRVVDVLARRYIELEQKATAKPVIASKLSFDARIERGDAPAAGFENGAGSRSRNNQVVDFLSAIAAARGEVQMLLELTQDIGNSLSLSETLSLLGMRLARVIASDAQAVYLRQGEELVPAFVNGENQRLFSSLRIPIGEGLSGWVADNNKPILNGNPSVEPGYLNDPNKFSVLRSALAVPLRGANGTLGVLALYHADKDAFTKDHQRILMSVAPKISFAIENALRYQQVENIAGVDPLTGLPNSRALFQHLDTELARARRSGESLAVAVCDLEGLKTIRKQFGDDRAGEALRIVASGLRQSLREYDYVARMGSDEFTVILPGLGRDVLGNAMTRLAASVELSCRKAFPEVMFTLDCGIAFFPDHGPDAEQLLAEADTRLYQEKRARGLGYLAEAVNRAGAQAAEYHARFN